MGSPFDDSCVCADGGVPLTLIALAVLGAALVVAGVALVSIPLALVVAGVVLIATAYLIAEEREDS